MNLPDPDGEDYWLLFDASMIRGPTGQLAGKSCVQAIGWRYTPSVLVLGTESSTEGKWDVYVDRRCLKKS